MKRKDRIPNQSASPKSQAPSPNAPLVRWGYLAGAVLCCVGLIILSVAFGQVLRTATRGFRVFSVPGTTSMDLDKTGWYMGVYQHKGEGPLPADELGSLTVNISETDSGFYVPVERTPGMQVLMAGGSRGLVLFQFEIKNKGPYLMNAVYPSGAGPSADVYLMHESLQHNRADIAVGILLCLVFCGFGIYVLVRMRKYARSLEPGMGAGGR